MATPTVTPTPKPRKKRGKSQDDSIPFYDGSYYLIVTRIAEAAKRETGLGNKLKGAAHEATALGRHTRRRFSALGLLGKVATGLLLVALGAGLAAGGWFLFVRRDPAQLRVQVRDHLAKGEWVEARRDLEALRLLEGGLKPGDRTALAEPLRAKLDAQAAKLRSEVERNARQRQHERALAALDRYDALEADPAWALFTRAELLRGAKRSDAAGAYERFVALYPGSDQADDALFWQAFLAKEGGRPADARALCETLLWKYPKSNFRTASDRLLAELPAPPAR
jgi:tetratricopeptide (TPR) repeat protein